MKTPDTKDPTGQLYFWQNPENKNKLIATVVFSIISVIATTVFVMGILVVQEELKDCDFLSLNELTESDGNDMMAVGAAVMVFSAGMIPLIWSLGNGGDAKKESNYLIRLPAQAKPVEEPLKKDDVQKKEPVKLTDAQKAEIEGQLKEAQADLAMWQEGFMTMTPKPSGGLRYLVKVPNSSIVLSLREKQLSKEHHGLKFTRPEGGTWKGPTNCPYKSAIEQKKLDQARRIKGKTKQDLEATVAQLQAKLL